MQKISLKYKLIFIMINPYYDILSITFFPGMSIVLIYSLVNHHEDGVGKSVPESIGSTHTVVAEEEGNGI